MDVKKELEVRSKLMFISRNLKIYEKIAVIFLICDKPYAGLKIMEILLTTNSKNLQNKAFFAWAKKQILLNCTDWQEKIAEVLACIQNYRLVKHLGYEKEQIVNKISSSEFLTSNIKISLYKLCEELNEAQTSILADSIEKEYNIYESTRSEDIYLERKILHWCHRKIISIDVNKKIILEPILKYVKSFNMNPDIINELKLKIEKADYDLLKSINAMQLQSNLPDYYNVINARNVGLCVIVNEKCFPNSELNLSKRWGSNKDVERLKETFTAYGFEVKIHTDIIYNELVELLNNYAKIVQKTDSFFVLIILSHGSENVIYTSDSVPVPMDEIEMIFQAENCPNLIGKPKIFIIQSCQGQKWQKILHGDQSNSDSEENEISSDAPQTTTMQEPASIGPQKGDSIIAWSTVQGYASFRDKHNGSWYIEELCNELWKFGRVTDLVDILTLVNNNLRSKTYDGQFMVPSLLSSLSCKIQFPYVKENWMKGRQLMYKRLFFEVYFLEFLKKSKISYVDLIKMKQRE